MRFQYQHLVGLPYHPGTRDCYEIGRDFFRDNEICELPNYARPDQWWNEGENMYMDLYHENGFRLFHGPVFEYQPADVFLMAVKSRVANHCAILLEDGRILHHFYGRLSEVCEYSGLWRNTTVAVLRHQSMENYRAPLRTVELPKLAPLDTGHAGAS